MKGGWISLWELPFYGLTLKPEDRIRIHGEINDIIYYGGGGYTLDNVYELPIFLRYFHLKRIAEKKEKESEAMKGGEEVKATPKKISPKPF